MRSWIGSRSIPRWLSGTLLLACLAVPTRGDSGAHRVADFLSGPGNLAYLGVFIAAILEGEVVFVTACVCVGMGQLNAFGVFLAAAPQTAPQPSQPTRAHCAGRRCPR